MYLSNPCEVEWNQFVEVLEQIQRIQMEIYTISFKTVLDETELSIRKPEELHVQLQALEKEKLEPIIISDDDTCGDDTCTPVGHSFKMKPKNSCGSSTCANDVDVSDPNVYSFRQNLQNCFIGSPVKVSFEGNGAVQHRVVTEKNGSYKRLVIDNWRDFLRDYGLAQGVYCQFVWLRETNVLNVSRVSWLCLFQNNFSTLLNVALL
ncbi:hypothetical protein QVD17_27203 [Tagetes erecta]|uniref:Uncharacterized protein n=1 Tax=Tagetes erecta TaxID=13708 RepID=A0AAD8NJ62_TARER|nr:hypothetical protein QVD17_27203 [Tagetes erecta]